MHTTSTYLLLPKFVEKEEETVEPDAPPLGTGRIIFVSFLFQFLTHLKKLTFFQRSKSLVKYVKGFESIVK